MQIIEKAKEPLPDFVALKSRFDAMGAGPRADIKRVRTFNELADLPAYYQWLHGIRSNRRMLHVAYLLPYAEHKSAALTLGQQLKKKNVSEMRLFQVVRSTEPRDLEQLRRLVIQVEAKVDWNDFGKTLYYWGKPVKQRMLEQYFTPIHK